MDTNRKGNISEAKILHAFVKAGYIVLIPFGNGASYDLAVDIAGRLWKVQVKTGLLQKGCVVFPLRRFSGRNRRVKKYQRGEIDLFAVYCPENDKIYLMHSETDLHQGRFRVEHTNNNQQQKIRWADEFEFDVFLENLRKDLVELVGLEPTTFALPAQRSSN